MRATIRQEFAALQAEVNPHRHEQFKRVVLPPAVEPAVAEPPADEEATAVVAEV